MLLDLTLYILETLICQIDGHQYFQEQILNDGWLRYSLFY